MVVRNQDADSRRYAEMKDLYRPSHADYTWEAKFGHRDWRGGGRASARETVARVAAGALAEHILLQLFGVEIVAWVDQVADISAEVDPLTVERKQVEETPVRCPDP
jgi:chorismate synthase